MAPIELKGGLVKKEDLDGIRDQLQLGADVAQERLACVKTGTEQVRLRPILGFGRLHSFVPRNLTKPEYQITMRGRSEQIRPLQCGKNIREKLR